jgi:hypothetical protein
MGVAIASTSGKKRHDFVTERTKSAGGKSGLKHRVCVRELVPV